MHRLQEAFKVLSMWTSIGLGCVTCCPLHSQREREALQWAAYEKQQKEIAKHEEIMQRLAGGAQSGRASQVRQNVPHNWIVGCSDVGSMAHCVQ